MKATLKKNRIEHQEIKNALSDEHRSLLTYDFSIVNNNSGLVTTVKKMPLKEVIKMLKKMETSLKVNIKDGVKVLGSHRASKNTRKRWL